MLEANKSYAIVSSSPLLQSLAIDYLIEANRQQQIYVGDSLFEKCLKISDTDTPSDRVVVISKIARENDQITTINLDECLVDVVFSMHGLDPVEHKDNIRLIKQKIKKSPPELKFYKVSAIVGTLPITTESITRACELNYAGVHTTTEQIDVLVGFISHPSEINLQRVVKVFNEDGYQKLINCVSMLVNDTPEWITAKYKQVIESAAFIKALLKITLITLKATDRNEFVLYCLKEIIY